MVEEIWFCDTEVWICSVCAEYNDGSQLPVIAILKEGTEEECRRMKKFFEENPDQIQVKNGDRSSMTFKFLVCPKALLDEV